MKSLHTFMRRNWIRILVGAPLLLTAVVAGLLVAGPQVGQAQGSVPAKPTGLTAAPGDTQATLTWDDPSDSSITGYEYLQEKVAKLTASDGAAHDHFGGSVSVDGHTAVVGAHGDNGAHGAAYVYMRQSGAWSQVAKLTASDGAAGDFFGYSVAVDADTVVVGAVYDGDNGDESGSAYVYEVSDWTDIPHSADGETNATSYTVTGLTNGAEYDFWIRATNSVGAGPASDAVTVTVGPPAQPTGLTATGGDGQATLTWDDPSDGSITGYDYLQAQVAKLTASDGAYGDHFGASVAVDGDTAVVGAYGDDNNRGAVYVLTRQSGTWGEVAKLTASDKDAGDKFGSTVAVDGDTVVVAAYGDDNYKGSAYLFTKPASGDWATATETAKLTASDRANYDWFGRSVAVDGDTVVVGVTFADGNSTSSGEIYVFTKPATGWSNATETAKLTASDGATADYFGDSVAIDGDTVVVGAWGDDNFKGSAYVYEISAWTAIPDSAADEDNGTSYTVTGLTNDEEYSFQIRATNALGTGPTSDAVTVTPSS